MAGIGHNNPPSLREEYQARFVAIICDKLRKIGIKGEVALTGNVIMISSYKEFSSLWRKSLRLACQNSNVQLVETRPQKGFYVFTIVI